MNIGRGRRVVVLACRRVEVGHLERVSRHFLPTLIVCDRVKVVDLEGVREAIKRELNRLLRYGELELDPRSAAEMGLLSPNIAHGDIAYVKLVMERKVEPTLK